MTPAQARALITGKRAFAPVRVNVMKLASHLEVRRLGRELGRTPWHVVTGLVAVWSWAAATWRPGGVWGEEVPVAVVDLIFDKEGAAAAAVRAGVATLVPVGDEDGIRLARLSGAPDIRAKHSWVARARKGNDVRWAEHRRARSANAG